VAPLVKFLSQTAAATLGTTAGGADLVTVPAIVASGAVAPEATVGDILVVRASASTVTFIQDGSGDSLGDIPRLRTRVFVALASLVWFATDQLFLLSHLVGAGVPANPGTIVGYVPVLTDAGALVYVGAVQ
jgi:hypothetical protein